MHRYKVNLAYILQMLLQGAVLATALATHEPRAILRHSRPDLDNEVYIITFLPTMTII